MRTLVLALALLLPHLAHAEPAGGFSPYAIAHPKWKCSEMFAGIKPLKQYRFAWLYNTFGHSYGCLDKLAKDPKTTVIETHLINEVCMRNGRCEKGEFGAGMKVSDFEGKLKRREKGLINKLKVYFAKAHRDILPHFKPTNQFYCFISPGLESNLSTEAAKVLIETARPYFPGCHMVWNPLRGKPLVGTLFEQHGESPSLKPLCVYNNDGTDVSPSEFPRKLVKYEGCSLCARWMRCENGNKGVDGFVPPSKRTGFCTKSDYDETVAALSGNAATPPVDSFAKEDLAKCKSQEKPNDGDKKFLFKTSDTKQCTQGKCAVALFPGRFNRQFRKVELWRKGKLIDKFKFEYFSNEHKDDDGARQTWKATKTPSQLPFYSVLNADGKCWPLKDPRVRID